LLVAETAGPAGPRDVRDAALNGMMRLASSHPGVLLGGVLIHGIDRSDELIIHNLPVSLALGPVNAAHNGLLDVRNWNSCFSHGIFV